MKQAIEKFIQYLRYERNASPDTIREYRRDIQQFEAFLTPPGEKCVTLGVVHRRVVRWSVSAMYDQRLENAAIARRLACLRTFC